MNSELVEEIEVLQRSVKALLERQEQHAQAQGLLVKRVRELEAECKQKDEEILSLRTQLSLDSAAASLGPDSQDSKEAKLLISQYVREIDSIIALLRM